jgi:hypothetical protein
VVVSTAAFRSKEMVVAATRSTIRHPTNIHLSNNHGVLIMDTATKIHSQLLFLAGSHLPQALVALHVGLPHLPLRLMNPMAESRCSHPRATHNPPLIAITHSLDVDPQDMVSLMIVDDQGIHTEEQVEIHTVQTEDSGTHTADSTEAVRKPDPEIVKSTG